MEAGMSLDDLWMRLQKASALGLDLLQHIEGGKDPIGQRLGKKVATVGKPAALLGNRAARTPGGSPLGA